jgi:hypothetical protein
MVPHFVTLTPLGVHLTAICLSGWSVPQPSDQTLGRSNVGPLAFLPFKYHFSLLFCFLIIPNQGIVEVDHRQLMSSLPDLATASSKSWAHCLLRKHHKNGRLLCKNNACMHGVSSSDFYKSLAASSRVSQKKRKQKNSESYFECGRLYWTLPATRRSPID